MEFREVLSHHLKTKADYKQTHFHDETVLAKIMAAFWNIGSCSVVEVNRGFGRACCLHSRQRPNDEGTSEAMVKFYEATRRNVPESLLICDAISKFRTALQINI